MRGILTTSEFVKWCQAVSDFTRTN
jgi:hypothetical protein